MRVSGFLQLCCILLTLFSTALRADEVNYQVTGVEEPMLTNVTNHVSAFRIGGSAKLNSRLRRKLVEDTKTASVNAMRPYGYFHPTVTVDIAAVKAGEWLVSVNVKSGPAVLITGLRIDLAGAGSDLPKLQAWRKRFPLAEGQPLNQQLWDKAKLEVMDLLESLGYLSAGFSMHTIRVDPVANTAVLDLVVDTGPQAVIGSVTFKQDILSDAVLASLQRFQSGDAFNAWLLGKFRLDLWRSGYFDDIRIVKRRALTDVPPRVDLEVELTPRKKNTYQGSFGFGTDTLARLQFRWGRHLLSPRGDNFDIGLGWQHKDNEFTFQTNYRLPRKTKTQQFWIASLGLKSENQSLVVAPDNDIENRFDLARGKYNDNSLRLGKTRVRNLNGGYEQLFETVFVQYLNERSDFELLESAEPNEDDFELSSVIDDLLGRNNNSLVVGLDWDWPEIRGNGFKTSGHHERAWVFTSNESWGSDANFSQVYLSSRFNFLAGDRWKFLLRAEAGYSDARTQEVDINSIEGNLNISASELPYLYRFKAGGSRSVRGYAFEILDNNGLGSNNILTGSAEVEFRFLDNWSVSAFADIGNAFNDWSEPDLKFGSGVGLRWYSIIGALRVDVAKGWDLAGEPWRIHLTIGTPLL
jgi:translocation and assembly module TamA